MKEREWGKVLSIVLERKQIPHYMQCQYLKESGIIKQDFWRDQFKNKVSVERICKYFFKGHGCQEH